MKSALAILRWIPPNKGGMKAHPVGPRYVRPVRFPQQKDTWTKEAWSLIVEWSEPPDETLQHHVTVRFLVDGAPDEFLVRGNRFELLEGDRIVAIGEVL